jgi:hypothetical protein
VARQVVIVSVPRATISSSIDHVEVVAAALPAVYLRQHGASWFDKNRERLAACLQGGVPKPANSSFYG